MKNLFLGLLCTFAVSTSIASNVNSFTAPVATHTENVAYDYLSSHAEQLSVSYTIVDGIAVSCTLTATFNGDGCSGTLTVTASTCAAAARAIATVLALSNC